MLYSHQVWKLKCFLERWYRMGFVNELVNSELHTKKNCEKDLFNAWW